MARLPHPLRPLWPYVKVAYTGATRAVSPVTRRLSALRGGYLPVAVADTVEQAVAGGGEFEVVRQVETLERPSPQGIPATNPTFEVQRREIVPRVAVAVLPNARVMAPHAAVITSTGRLVAEFSPYFGTRRPSEHPLYLHPFPEEPLFVDDRLGVLATRGDANFYHFLIDVIPKLGVLEQAGAIDTPKLWYAPMATRFQRELLAAVGLTVNNTIDSSAVPHIQARELVVPGLPDAHLRTPPWIVEFLRAKLLPADAGLVPGHRIFVTRGRARHNRIVVNEAELLSTLRPLGFAVVNPGALSVAEQIRQFAWAEVIVAPHGAALSNLAFTSPGASVVELFPPDFVQGCYWKLASCVPGLQYRYVIGAGRTVSATRAARPDKMRGISSDVLVDPAVVVGQVERLIKYGRKTKRYLNGCRLNTE